MSQLQWVGFLVASVIGVFFDQKIAFGVIGLVALLALLGIA